MTVTAISPETVDAVGEEWGMDSRWWVFVSPDLLTAAAAFSIGVWDWSPGKPARLSQLATLLYQADRMKMMGRSKRTPMDINALVKTWVEVIVGLSTAHDHAARTEADERQDDILGPILAAPIKQVREFARALATALEADGRVPFMVWSSFKRAILPVVMKGPDGEIIELKVRLAREIAEMVEKDIPAEDWVEAIAGALQWRSPETLEKVKAAVATGAKPRVRGRESCLFLDLDVADGEPVTVVL